ncbi:MAG: ferritin family protein [bacterium]
MNNLIADTKLAIELEKKGYDFYAQTAAKTKNPLASITLNSLANRELDHLAKIKEFYQQISGVKQLPSDWLKGIELFPTKKDLLTNIINKLRDNLDKKFETQEDINEAYKIAEGLETDSYNLYKKISDESTDETAKKFFAALAVEEQEHYDIMAESLQYLNKPGDWFKEQERWIVEG